MTWYLGENVINTSVKDKSPLITPFQCSVETPSKNAERIDIV